MHRKRVTVNATMDHADILDVGVHVQRMPLKHVQVITKHINKIPLSCLSSPFTKLTNEGMPSKMMLLVMGKVWNGLETKGFVHVDDDHCHGQESSADSWREMGSKHQTPLP